MLINSDNIGRNPWNFSYPDDQWHHDECVLHEDRTGFVCVECREEIEQDAEECDVCKVARYDRSIPDDVYDNGPIFKEGDCSCDGILEDMKYGHHHYY